MKGYNVTRSFRMWGWDEESQRKEWEEQRQGKMGKGKQVSGEMDTAKKESKGRQVKHATEQERN